MKQEISIICESVILDKNTNKISLIGMFDNMTSAGVPTVYPKFSVFTRFEGGEGEHNHKIIVRHEAGNPIAELSGKINFGTNKKAQYVGEFIALPFPSFGKYKIEIYIDNELQPMTNNIEVVSQ